MKNIINGEYCDASDQSVMEIVNPYTGEVVDYVPNSTEKDVNLAVQAAKRAQKKWAQVPVYKKVEILNKFLDLVDENSLDIATTLSVETGKPLKEAIAEVGNIRIGFTGFMEKAKHLYGQVIPAGTEAGQDNTIQITVREPLGVIVAIIPFNFPLDLFDQKVAPAILAGNSIIVKPPYQNPTAIIKVSALLHKAGLPDGVVQVLTGDGVKTGVPLCLHKDVHGITFTGSAAAGKSVYQNAATHYAHATLELGANDAFIVLDNADVDLAVEEVIWGRMYNAGQVCCASKRFLVQRGVLKEFESKVVDRLSKLVVGDPMDKNTDMGPLVTKAACEKVASQVKKVVAQGGRILLGGQSHGAIYEPTVITDIPSNADVAKDDEIFGPVVSIIPFDKVEDAIKIANQSSYGLGGCVFSKDLKLATQIATKLESGGVVINGASFHRSFEMPFGGYKMSGIGTEGVMTTFDHVTTIKTVTLKNILK